MSKKDYLEQLNEQEISSLSNNELVIYGKRIKHVVDSISEDLEVWKLGILTQHNEEWYRRAKSARGYYKIIEIAVKAEKRKRPEFDFSQNPPADTLKQSHKYNSLKEAILALLDENKAKSIFLLAKEIFNDKQEKPR